MYSCIHFPRALSTTAEPTPGPAVGTAGVAEAEAEAGNVALNALTQSLSCTDEFLEAVALYKIYLLHSE